MMKKTFLLALKNSIPIMFAYIVVGFTFGIMMNEAGYTWLHSLIAGITIYSGSLQIAMVPMMKARTSLPVMAFATLLINSRYMFYGIGYTERFKKQGKLYPYMIAAFPDEVYGVFSTCVYPPDIDAVKCDRWTAFLCHGAWITGGLIGTIFGSSLPFDLSGIEFAATSMFVCLFIDQCRHAVSRIPMITGIICGLLCLLFFGASGFMLPALSFSLIALVLLRKKVEVKRNE